ncbi:DNA mismatch repair protein MutT [Sphaerisporangium rufum]|uniref:DNA mismatch repair protein MutT n=1 Tax=Sphaerisporangium rufum TaxID=1381558 RepID=A0A919UZX7_9ACTN|nr:NUDIX domain-containing protein [Sphaerisporangium rufum]GII76782.1 DNA mismatch repair protein MutT [Sphaerisporangium rufum]
MADTLMGETPERDQVPVAAPRADARLRPTARILLVDARDRILLFHGPDMMKIGTPAWFTPGGGVDRGEDLPAAAARELLEETGIRAAPADFGPVVAVSAGHWVSRKGRLYYSRDSYFFLRVAETAVDTSGMEVYEAPLLSVHRWWTPAELRTTAEHVIPLGLAGLLGRLLAGDAPPAPAVLPWHHREPPL